MKEGKVLNQYGVYFALWYAQEFNQNPSDIIDRLNKVGNKED